MIPAQPDTFYRVEGVMIPVIGWSGDGEPIFPIKGRQVIEKGALIFPSGDTLDVETKLMYRSFEDYEARVGEKPAEPAAAAEQPRRRGRQRKQADPLPPGARAGMPPEQMGMESDPVGRTIGRSNIPNVNHPDIARELDEQSAELEAQATMRRLREQGMIETTGGEPAPDEDLVG